MFDMYRHFLLMFSSLWPVFRLLYGLNSKSLARRPGLTPHSTGPKLTWMAQKLVNWWHLYLEVSPAVLMNTNGALCHVPSWAVTVLDLFLADDQSRARYRAALMTRVNLIRPNSVPSYKLWRKIIDVEYSSCKEAAIDLWKFFSQVEILGHSKL